MQASDWAEFWLKRWTDGIIHFHQEKIEAMLARFPAVTNEVVLVPLCGKTKDMVHFAELGNQVIGAELSLTACESFFVENQIAYERRSIPGFVVFQSKSITIYCGDFFSLPLNLLQNVTLIYDRAALIALPTNLRIRYAELIINIAKNCSNSLGSFKIYLISLEYAAKKPDLPPFSVGAAEIEALYGKRFKIEKLVSEKDILYSPTTETTEPQPATESAYLLTQKQG